MNLSFREAANGCMKKVSFSAKNVCDSCGKYAIALTFFHAQFLTALCTVLSICESVDLNQLFKLLSCGY
jgi:hypothetical protein